MDSIKLLLAFDVNDISETKYLYENEVFDIVACVDNGRDAIRMIDRHKPDAVLLDMVLPELDGLAVMEHYRDRTNPPLFLVMSTFKDEKYIRLAFKSGARHFLLKPIEPDVVVQRIIQTVKMNNEESEVMPRSQKNKSLDERLSSIFISVGIPAHIKGYQFLREGIKLAVDQPPIINNITKVLYPAIAERYQTTSSKVERAIRHAIEVAWSRGKIENINALFGVKVYTNHDKPTNGEFIALLADKMILEGA